MKKTFKVNSTRKEEIIDITSEVKKIVRESGIKEGICLVYTPHATAAVIINENYDPNICQDLLDCLRKLIPEGKWLHDRIDNNAAAHLKSAVIGSSQSLIIEQGELVLGRWQNLMLCDFDGPREREVVVKIIEG